MIFTSYFANWRRFKPGMIPTSIARYSPKGFVGEAILELAPNRDILVDKKSGKISEEEYKTRYLKQLFEIPPKDWATLLNNRILLCYEVPHDFCHRQILREWLSEQGVSVQELESGSKNRTRPVPFSNK